VIDYAWVPVAYLLVIQPTRFSLYIFNFALGVHAYRRRWFTDSGYNPRIAIWLPLSVLLGAAFMFYKLTFGLKLREKKANASSMGVGSHCSRINRWIRAKAPHFQS
jgi:hypothetical protein